MQGWAITIQGGDDHFSFLPGPVMGFAGDQVLHFHQEKGFIEVDALLVPDTR